MEHALAVIWSVHAASEVTAIMRSARRIASRCR